MMDITEGVGSMRMSFQALRSSLDSFCFEIGKCIIMNDLYRIEYLVKMFKSQQIHQVNQINSELGHFESEILNNELVIKAQQTEREKEVQEISLKNLTGRNANLLKENEEMRKELESMKQTFYSIKNFKTKKDNIIAQLKQTLKNCQDNLEKEKIKSKNTEQCQSNESRSLKETLQTKETEIENLNKDKKELKMNIMDISKQLSELRKILKENESKREESQLGVSESGNTNLENQTDESKNEMKKKEIVKTMETRLRNTLKNEKINVNNKIHKLKDEIKIKDSHLKADYILIKSLKNEIIRLHNQIKDENHQRRKVKFEEIKRKSLKENICFEEETHFDNIIQPCKTVSDGISQGLTKQSEKETNYIIEINEVKKSPDENTNSLVDSENKLHRYQLKIDHLEKELAKSRGLIRSLNIMKSVSEEKIKLLNQFIEDFRIKGL